MSCSRCRACEAAIGGAAVANPVTALHQVHRVRWFSGCVAADRSLRQRLQGSRWLCSRCRACEAAIDGAAVANPVTVLRQVHRVRWFSGCVAADRSLRQRLQGSRWLCSRCRACEAAIGGAAVANPVTVLHQVHRVRWFSGCVAAGRSLRQRLQGLRCLCSRCRAYEAAIGGAAVANPVTALHQVYRVRWFSGCCAAGRSLAVLGSGYRECGGGRSGSGAYNQSQKRLQKPRFSSSRQPAYCWPYRLERLCTFIATVCSQGLAV
ncbi:hypothetical protein C4K18_2898 [Pseudomonas chlororaphis subsp. aurantiaca]|nr:hypothetical protein C4K18_2898 [Pseudomonas chlororaphis subsp. aurantiaca]